LDFRADGDKRGCSGCRYGHAVIAVAKVMRLRIISPVKLQGGGNGGRIMRSISSVFGVLGLLVPCSMLLAAGPFEGKFSDGKLTAQWVHLGNQAGAADSYAGTISLGQQQFQSTAHADGQAIEGDFLAGANSFPFSGKLDGETLTLTTGGATYTLQRQAAAVNPLGGGETAAPVNPLTTDTPPAVPPAPLPATPQPIPTVAPSAVAPVVPSAAAGNLPAGYSVVSTTDAGRALAAQKQGTATVTSALRSTFSDLSGYFDGKPTIVRGYQDTQDSSSGGASFTANLNGQPVKGLVSCKLNQSGAGASMASVAVLYCKATATPADWKKLMAPAGGGASAGPADAAAITLHDYQFADGTGSIGLADGWTTNAQTCHGMFIVTGPADQVITMQLNVTVVTPNSTSVRMNQQLNANAVRMGGQPRPLGLYVAQMSAQRQRKGGTAFTLDHLTEIRQTKPMLPKGRAAFANYGISVVENGQPKHRLVLALMEVDPVGNDSFMFGMSTAGAPDATFKSDLPTMLAIMNSLKENAAVFQQQTQQQIARQNQWFAAQQASQRKVQAAYDDYNKDMATNSIIRARSDDNFDEVIRGVRTVEDTSTGEKTSVDLGNVDNIVDNLNYAQPGRYKEIPLRDEADPLPGQ
jgi:hypothetical protein